MPVYVDELMEWSSNLGGLWCHMVADTSEELDMMAQLIGLKPEWKQKPGTAYEHFDLRPELREIALTHGARELSLQEMAGLIDRKLAERRR